MFKSVTNLIGLQYNAMQQSSGGILRLLILTERRLPPPVPVAIYPDFQIFDRAAVIFLRFLSGFYSP